MTNEEIEERLKEIVEKVFGDKSPEDSVINVATEAKKFQENYPTLSMMLLSFITELSNHHDVLESHDEKLELLRAAVVDSGCVELAQQNQKQNRKLSKTMIN